MDSWDGEAFPRLISRFKGRRLAKSWRVVRRPWMGRVLDESGVMLRTIGDWKLEWEDRRTQG